MKSYKYKIKPSKRIEKVCEQWLEICRELYNAGLQERRDAYRMAGISINYSLQSAQLPEIKPVREDVAQVNAQVLQDTLRRLQKAFDSFFSRIKQGKPAGYPRFKSKKRFNAFTFPQAKGTFRLEGNKLYLSKIGSMRIHLSRPIEGKIKTCTIKKEADGWYVIFAVEEDRSRFFPKTNQVTGIDLGIENLATLSDGTQIENPRHLNKVEKELKTAQRRVARRKQGSNRRKKAVILLAKKYLKLSRQRLDYFHKVALFLVKEFDHIAIEDLNIAGLVKNHHLAKAISDVAWNSFISILTSKAESAGRTVQKVDPRFTSQDCSQCRARVKKSLSERAHRCIGCGLTLHRDQNTALNILLKAGALPSGIEKVTSLSEPRISIYTR